MLIQVFFLCVPSLDLGVKAIWDKLGGVRGDCVSPPLIFIPVAAD